jgi:general secretion pathway protein A
VGALQNNPYIRFFSFFGLRENPFAVSPDPRYLFMTPQIQEAWHALAFGIQSREGIIVFTGEAGTGKTTLINRLLEWLRERRMPTAFIFNSHLEPKHLFDFMLADFGVQADPRHLGNSLMCLSRWLPERCREGQIPVLIVDEAQGLPLQVLEEIRLLLNLESPNEKLLQIVLAGQPELEDKLKRPELRQLKQRIALRCRTGALTLKETHEYIQVRLNIAGAAGKSIFSPDAMNAVHDYSRGIPRVMNLLCEHALINSYAGNMHVVPARVVNEIAREFQFDEEAYAPSIRKRTIPARIYEPLVVAEGSFLPVQAAAPSVTSPLEAAAPLAFSTPVEPVPTLAARNEPAMALRDHDELVRSPRQSDVSLAPVRPSTVGAAGNTAPMKTSEVELHVSAGRQMIAGVLATRLQIVRFLIIVRAGVITRALDLSEALHQGTMRIFDIRVLRRLAIKVKSGVVLGTRRLSARFSREAPPLRLLWRNAGSACQRIRGTLQYWLGQPLAQRHSSPGFKSNSQRTNLWAKFAFSFNWPRSWQASRDKSQPVGPSSSRIKVNAPVRRWLRQPFRPSQSPRANSRAAANQRSRIPSGF